MIDLHRHLEAAPHLDALPKFIIKHNIDLPHDLGKLKETLLFQSRPGDLISFLRPFNLYIHKFFISEAAVKDFTKLSVERAFEEGISYLELRFSPFYMTGLYAGASQLSAEAIVNAVIEGVKEASKESSIEVGLILIVGRELDSSIAKKAIQLAIKYREDICGVDLAGDESNFPPHLFYDAFVLARDEGLPITIHAGEAGPAENIRYAIEHLGARRIGHGIAAAFDDGVMDLIKASAVTLEICPTSNWLTGAVTGDITQHPLMKLHRAGIKVTINSDDPMIQGTGLIEDIRIAGALGATEEDLRIFTKNAQAAAFKMKNAG